MKYLNKSVRVVFSPKDRLDNEYIVAMKTSTTVLSSGYADYHFAVQLSDGTWADKPGKGRSRWNVIKSPMQKWDLGNQKGYYNVGTIYFAVKE